MGGTGAPSQSMPSQAEQIRQLKQKKGKKGKKAIKVQGVAVQEERTEPDKKANCSVVSDKNDDQISQQAVGFEASEHSLKKRDQDLLKTESNVEEESVSKHSHSGNKARETDKEEPSETGAFAEEQLSQKS